MEIFEKKEKTTNRHTKILLIINLIIWTIILFIIIMFNGVVHALTPVEMNFTYYEGGNTTTYNIRPDGGTTGFIYNNEFFGQTISHSAYKHYLPSTGSLGEIRTNNINGYFVNPCQNNQNISYTMEINFYAQGTNSNELVNVQFTNGVNECTGYHVKTPLSNNYTYYNTCNLQAGDVPKFSLYFTDTTRGQTYYRVGVPVNFSYTCEIGNQAIIDNATANTNKLILELWTQHSESIQQLEATFNHVNPDSTDFDSLEQAENTLHQYTNVNLNSFQVDLDTDTNNWVWTTLTTLLNTHTLIFGMVISILSIGLIKLILNR